MVKLTDLIAKQQRGIPSIKRNTLLQVQEPEVTEPEVTEPEVTEPEVQEQVEPEDKNE